MSFKPFQYLYRPPKTVPNPVAPQQVLSSTSPAVAVGSASNAGQIMQQLDSMVATSQYLQTVVLNRTRKTGVEIDPATDPEVARALTQIFQTPQPPSTVTMSMYNNLLDAEIGAMRLEMVLGADSHLEPDGNQYADLSLVTKRVEKHLIDTGEFKHQVPLLLRGLKGDDLIFSAWKSQIAQYPAASPSVSGVLENAIIAPQNKIRMQTLDMSAPVFDHLDSYLTDFSSVYASVYKTLADVNHVERDISSVLDAYFFQPVEDLIRMISIFESLRGFVHKFRMQDLSDALTNFVFVRMLAEVSELHFWMDRMINVAVSPLKSMVGKVGQALATIQGMFYSVARVRKKVDEAREGGLRGLSAINSCGSALPHNRKKTLKQPKIPALDSLSEGLQTLAQHLDWGTRETARQQKRIEESFRKLAAKRLKNHGDRLDLMCSTQALDTLSSLAKSIVSETQKGTVGNTAAGQQKLEAVGRILTSLKSGTGSAFSIQDGEVVVTPPDVPPVPDGVAQVLARGGLDQTEFQGSSLATTMGAVANAA